MAAVLAVGSWTLVSPASADALRPQIPGVTGTGGALQVLAGGTWTAGTEEGGDGNWVAYIECCDGFLREDVGTYETRREARRAAKDAAKEANGVVDGPGCVPPVLC